MKKAKKIKLIINKTNFNTFEFWLRRCKTLYNVCIDQYIYHYQGTGKTLNKYVQKKELTLLKKEDPSWNDIPNKSLQEIVFRVATSFKNFFNGFGFPKHKTNDNFTSIFFAKTDVRIKNGLVYLPKIKNGIKGVEEFPNDFTGVKLKKENDDYFLVFVYNTTPNLLEEYNNDVVGCDLGLKSLMVDSNGYEVKRFSTKLIKKYEARIAELNKSLSSKKLTSKRRKKVKKQLNKTHLRLKNTRYDYVQKESTKYIKQVKEDTIVVGKFEVKKLMESDNTKKQKNFSRSYSNAAISIFTFLLEYKAKQCGKTFEKVNESYTSKTCSCCLHVKHNLTVKDRVFNCDWCGVSLPRDENGSINIKRVYNGTFKPIGIKLKDEKNKSCLAQAVVNSNNSSV